METALCLRNCVIIFAGFLYFLLGFAGFLCFLFSFAGFLLSFAGYLFHEPAKPKRMWKHPVKLRRKQRMSRRLPDTAGQKRKKR